MNIRSAFIVILLSTACGSEPPVVPPGASDLIPLAVGNEWTYRLTSSSGTVSTKVQTITSTASVDGMIAYRIETARNNEKGTISLQRIEDGRLKRISEETTEAGVVTERFTYRPAMVRIDSTKVADGDVYVDRHDKVQIDEAGNDLLVESKVHTFTVEAATELVTVPAGTFECVRVRRDLEGGSSKTYWYAKGVGKVKEVGGQTEELQRSRLSSSSD